jgi:hypothetical protein
MYAGIPPKIELTLDQFNRLAERFKAIKHSGDLAGLIKADAAILKKLADKPHYLVFTIPKPGGLKRLIHNPFPDLKEIQQHLNQYLQAAYYQIKPPCSFGFIPLPADESRPRNIYTNALAHAGSNWVLNLDLADFFHNVNSRHLGWIFRELFEFPEALADQLTALCSFKGILPMGAPTSPVLANLSCLLLDIDLQTIAIHHNAIYTRYVDDLTFSFDSIPTLEFTSIVRETAIKHGFALNESKIRLKSKEQFPEVTGLILKTPKPDVSPAFLKSLKRDLKMYRRIISPGFMQRHIFQTSVLDKLRRSLQGQIQFLGFVRGTSDRTYLKLSAFIQ